MHHCDLWFVVDNNKISANILCGFSLDLETKRTLVVTPERTPLKLASDLHKPTSSVMSLPQFELPASDYLPKLAPFIDKEHPF